MIKKGIQTCNCTNITDRNNVVGKLIAYGERTPVSRNSSVCGGAAKYMYMYMYILSMR